MNREVRVVSFVSEERGDTSSLARRIVVGELSQRKQLRPVVLLVVAVGAEVLFEGLIDLLSLTIPFRMISRSEVELHTKHCAEAAEEMRDELCPAVRCNMTVYSVLREDMEYKEAGQLYCGKSVVGQNEDSLLGESVTTTRMAMNPAEAGSCL